MGYAESSLLKQMAKHRMSSVDAGVNNKVHEFLSSLSWFQMNNQEKFIIIIENV